MKSIRELLAAAPERLVGKDTDLAELCREEGGRLGAETLPREHSHMPRYRVLCTHACVCTDHRHTHTHAFLPSHVVEQVPSHVQERVNRP